jgi:hypothetical protein
MLMTNGNLPLTNAQKESRWRGIRWALRLE